MRLVDLSELRVGMSREDVIAKFGEPELKGVTSRRYKTPQVFRYGRTEFIFEQRETGGLVFVQEVDEFGFHVRIVFGSPESRQPACD
jgi:hypothetical protein